MCQVCPGARRRRIPLRTCRIHIGKGDWATFGRDMHHIGKGDWLPVPRGSGSTVWPPWFTPRVPQGIQEPHGLPRNQGTQWSTKEPQGPMVYQGAQEPRGPGLPPSDVPVFLGPPGSPLAVGLWVLRWTCRFSRAVGFSVGRAGFLGPLGFLLDSFDSRWGSPSGSLRVPMGPTTRLRPGLRKPKKCDVYHKENSPETRPDENSSR